VGRISIAFNRNGTMFSEVIFRAHILQRGRAQPALAFQEAYVADQARFDPAYRRRDRISFAC
jgi:hypothetical protein